VSGNNSILTSDENDISAMVAGYKQFDSLLKDAYESGDEYAIEHFESLTKELEDIIFITVEDLQEQKNNINTYYDTIKDIPYEELDTEQRKIVDSYNGISDAIALIYKQLSPNTWNSIQIDNIFDTKGIEKTKDELVSMALSGELTPEIIESYQILNATLQES
jgi:hypothetical protein